MYDLPKFRQEFFFTFVPGSFFAVTSFIFMSGFLSAYSFLQVPKEERYTAKNLGTYYAKKLLKYLPINIIAFIFGMYVFTLMGAGPIWHYY